ncbi:MAG: hypothetical protein ACI9FN_003180 [Saprospiraceae bacterium]
MNQKKEIEDKEEVIEALLKSEKENSEKYTDLYTKCLETKKRLEVIDSVKFEKEIRIAEKGKYRLGISYPSLTNAEALELSTLLKNEGFRIWYANEKTDDLGNMYYYKNWQDKAKEHQGLIYRSISI